MPRFMPVCDPVPGATDSEALHTFKRRGGRLTPGQRRALDELWHRYGVGSRPGREGSGAPEGDCSATLAGDGSGAPEGDCSATLTGDGSGAPAALPALLDPVALFGRRAPLVLEIGFGMGETTVAMAAADPGRDVLAIDVHIPGAGALLREAAALGLDNVRVIVGDAVTVLRDLLPPGSLDEVRVYFPDPWPKARHHKRRLVGPAFARLVGERLRPGGRLHVATDWAPYAERIVEVVEGEPALVNEYDGFAPRPSWRPVTRFEQQGLAKGHEVFDVLARRPES